jgi:hypothetical protein
VDGDYQGDGQWPDALAAAARGIESKAWCAYWSRPYCVERELYASGPLRVVAVKQPQSARSSQVSASTSVAAGYHTTAAKLVGVRSVR